MNNYYKEEVECAHMYLDDLKIPRGDALSLVGRIKQLETKLLKEMSSVEDYYLNQTV